MDAAMTVDPLFIDVYIGDGHKDWPTFCAAGTPWHGCVFKATQGTYYRPQWYATERRMFIEAAGDLFDGAYHYLDFSLPGDAQADYFMKAVDLAGGEKIGTLWAMVDVERGGQRIQNPSRAQVEDCTRAFSARYTALSGRTATLYGGELLRATGVQDRLGCGRSAIALYGQTLPSSVVTRTGTDIEHLFLWQYSGSEIHELLANYPDTAPGCGKVDISAMVMPGGIDRLRSLLWAEHP
jgi:GH25 family lysozyme M1 (1,4-beta-N-acetylmuramidase)